MCTWNISTTLFQVLLGSSHVTPIHIPPLFRHLAWDLMAHSREWHGQVIGMCCCIIRELLCVCRCGGDGVWRCGDRKVNTVLISGQLHEQVCKFSCMH